MLYKGAVRKEDENIELAIGKDWQRALKTILGGFSVVFL